MLLFHSSCIFSVWKPWYMHMNDSGPYVVLTWRVIEMGSLSFLYSFLKLSMSSWKRVSAKDLNPTSFQNIITVLYCNFSMPKCFLAVWFPQNPITIKILSSVFEQKKIVNGIQKHDSISVIGCCSGAAKLSLISSRCKSDGSWRLWHTFAL